MGNETTKSMPKVGRIITGIICVLLVIILASNLTVIIKGALNPERPPSIFGITTMMVMSGSMSGDAPDHIEVGDMIITMFVDPEKLEVGDVITFVENGTTVTHRIIEINEDDTFTTKGDANNSADTYPVKQDDVVGRFLFRIPRLGDVALFAQTPLGMLIFIGVPLVVYLILDFILRLVHGKKDKVKEESEKEKLERELAELKAKVNAECRDNAEMQNAECRDNAEMQNAECRNENNEEAQAPEGENR